MPISGHQHRVMPNIRWGRMLLLLIILSTILGAATTFSICCSLVLTRYVATDEWSYYRLVVSPTRTIYDVAFRWAGTIEEIWWSDSNLPRDPGKHLFSGFMGTPDVSWSVLTDPSAASVLLAKAKVKSQSGALGGIREVASGWPMPTMKCSFADGTAAMLVGDRFRCIDGIGFTDWTKDGLSVAPRGIPLVPIWPGFIISTTGWSTAWFSLFALFYSRRAWRDLRTYWKYDRRSRCSKCSYPRIGIPQAPCCPECGQQWQ